MGPKNEKKSLTVYYVLYEEHESLQHKPNPENEE